MAKARSNMGQKAIGSLQYDDREIIPNVKVDVDTESQGNFTFDLMKNSLPNDNTESTGVRKRTKESEDGVETIGADNEKSNTENKDKDASTKNVIKDPILMFGVLVPQSLRLSKSCFQRSLPVVSKICATQAEILRLKAEYQNLRSQVE